jgi:hypothetical protein
MADSGTPYILCKSQPWLGASISFRTTEIFVEVALNGAQYTNTSATVKSKFLYYTQPTISATRPWGGPSVGGANVQVLGDGFFDKPYLVAFYTCRYTTIAGVAYTAAAVYKNTTEMSCSKPSNLLETSFIDIAMNGLDFTAYTTTACAESEQSCGNFSYSFYTQLVIDSIFPLAGATSGGSVINVKAHPNTTSTSTGTQGSNLKTFQGLFKKSLLDDMRCQFSDRDTSNQVVARFNPDGERITCDAMPSWPIPSVVSVSVAMNGVDYVDSISTQADVAQQPKIALTFKPDVRRVRSAEAEAPG